MLPLWLASILGLSILLGLLCAPIELFDVRLVVVPVVCGIGAKSCASGSCTPSALLKLLAMLLVEGTLGTMSLLHGPTITTRTAVAYNNTDEERMC